MEKNLISNKRINKLLKELPNDYKKITLWIIENYDFFYKLVEGCSITDIRNVINRAGDNDTKLLETLLLFKIACDA